MDRDLAGRASSNTRAADGGRTVPYRALLAGLFSALLGVILLAACQAYEFNGTEYPGPQPASDFVLDDVSGGSFRLSEGHGKIFLIYFGYTSCPDVCPATLATARLVLDSLGEDADRVAMLFVTVDPERDTPEVMRNYVSAFHPNIIGLTGAPETLGTVFEDYGIVAEREELPESAVGYVMNHTTRLFLVDQEGRLRMSFGFGTPPEEVSQDVQHLLKE